MYDKPEYANMRTTAAQIVSEGGVARLWTGLAPRMVRIVGESGSGGGGHGQRHGLGGGGHEV